MKRMLTLALSVGIASSAPAQVPDGYYVWCSFQGTAGQTGVFFQHPRDPGPPIVVTGLNPDLLWVPGGRQGASCVIIRPDDGALLVGERAAQGNSVDLHIMRLRGSEVMFDQLIGMGVAGRAGEIPQCALLPDGKIVLAATDLTAGPLAVIQTQSYGYEGVGIVDPIGGNVTPVPVANPSVFASGVFNGLTASPDGSTCYIANYVSSTQGEVWAVPLPQGGTATLVATVSAGVSNLGIDQDGGVLIAALNGPPNLWKLDVTTGQLTVIPTQNGPLNAIALESVTGNWAVASANSGIPPRSVFWMEPNGTEHLLVSPNMATISGIAVDPNPKTFGAGTPGASSYDWQLAPNPGGLPLVGNAGFGVTVAASVPSGGTLGGFAVALQQAAEPIPIAGIELLLDPGSIVVVGYLPPLQTMTIPLPIPNQPSLVGGRLYMQSFHVEANGLAASAGLRLTIL